MEKYFAEVPQITEGSVVKGRIIDIRANEVLVDIGYKSEGIIPKWEFMEPEALKLGDEIEVLLEHIEDDNGMVVLSHEKAEQKKNWTAL
jgi:small subunit ribosomal protein S1